MSPRELIALAIGLLLGIALQRPEKCRRACCMSSERRRRWQAGEDVSEPPRGPC